MKAPIWDKAGVHVDEGVMQFLAGDDVVLDRALFAYDIEASREHVRGLHQIGALAPDAADQLLGALKELDVLWNRGDFILDDRYEDGHSAIESFLTERLGVAGGRVHLGRSRNDQVLVAIRMYVMDQLGSAAHLALDAAEAALERARSHEFDPMPGYTHTQRAMPSSVGLWMASFAESFADDAEITSLTLQWLDACPLGTAAGYGVNAELPRADTAARLGFERLVINPMHAQASRGKTEMQTLSALWQTAQTIRRLAWDLTLFSSAEFAFVTLPPRGVTGSSMMPNKRNPDLAELLRTVAPVVGGAIAELQQAVSLPSGYHRDLQATKAPLLRGCTSALAALALLPSLIRDTTFHTAAMRAAIDTAMYATDAATSRALAGEAFRDAYRHVGDHLDQLGAADPEVSLRARTSYGGPGNLGLHDLRERLASLRSTIRPKRRDASHPSP